MTTIKTTTFSGGSGLVPGGSAADSLTDALRDIADDLTALRNGINGLDIAAADPTAISAGALGAFTDPPSAAEMSALRTLVNELRTTVIELRTIALELKADVNAATPVAALLTIKG